MKSLVTVFVPLVMIGIHLWSVVLSIQVNGLFSVWGFIAAGLSLVLPLISELLWGFWSYKHSHPFFIGAVIFWVIIGIAKVAHMCGAFGGDEGRALKPGLSASRPTIQKQDET